MNFDSMALSKKLFVTFGVVLALLCSVAVASYWALSSMANATHEIADVASVKALAAENITGLTGYIHESQTRFVLTQNASYADHEGDIQAFNAALADLARVSKTASDLAFLAGVRARYATVLHYDSVLHSLVAAGDQQAAIRIVQGGADSASDALASAATAYENAAKHQAAAAAASSASTHNTADWIIGVVTALSIGVALLFAFLLLRSINRPLAKVMEGMRSLNEHDLADFSGGLEAVAQGDLTRDAHAATEPIELHRDDELGRMVATFNEMLAKTHDGLDSYNHMRATLSDMLLQVSETSTVVASASQQMANTSSDAGRAVGEINQAIGEVSQGAERQAQMVASASATADKVVEAIGQTADSAQQASEVAAEVRDAAEEGMHAAQQASDAMHAVSASTSTVTEAIRSLAEKSGEISAIVQTIRGLADQTNLLALNAAIEAARAGDQGRGFAVVAEEVRNLAEESQRAAGEISSLIGKIQSETNSVVEIVEDGAARTEDGASTVEQTRQSFERIGHAVIDMSTRVDQIAAAAQQVAAESQQMQGDIAEVASVAQQSSASSQQASASSQQTAASTQQIAASAQDLAATAESLNQLVSQFKTAA